jgi:hypothetical protein
VHVKQPNAADCKIVATCVEGTPAAPASCRVVIVIYVMMSKLFLLHGSKSAVHFEGAGHWAAM